MKTNQAWYESMKTHKLILSFILFELWVIGIRERISVNLFQKKKISYVSKMLKNN